MSAQHIDAVRSVYERWSEGDFRASMDVLDPHALLVLRPEFMDAGLYLGVERIEEYTRHFLEPWSRITIEAEELTEAGDSVIAAVLQSGVGSESGISTELRYFHVWTFRGDRVVRLESIREREEALEAVGLR